MSRKSKPAAPSTARTSAASKKPAAPRRSAAAGGAGPPRSRPARSQPPPVPQPSAPGKPAPAAHGQTAPAARGRRLALLICNGSFLGIDNLHLPGPAKDAVNLEAVLSDPDTCQFTVRTLVDRGLLEVRREIARACAEAGADDTLLIYYSGNGLRGSDGSLYLLVADSERDFLYATGLDSEFILSQLRGSRCRKIVLLIDCCSAGAFFAQNRGIPNGLYAVTSCADDETCIDTPEGGAFTLALCEGLRHAAADRDGDGMVSIDDLHEFAKRRLLAGAGPGNPSGVPQKWVWNVPEPIYIATAQRPVFLSYAREDKAEADRLARALEAEGLPVWIDTEGITSGNWKERVTEGLDRARAAVMLLTPSSLVSEAVRKEIAFADNRRVPIIPVQLGEVPPDALPGWFAFDYGELHRHDLRAEPYPECVRKLAAAIRGAGARGGGANGR